MKALSDVKLNYLIQKIKTWVNDTFCLKSHTHDVGEDSTGVLKPENGGTGSQSIDELKKSLGLETMLSGSNVQIATGVYEGIGRTDFSIQFYEDFYPKAIFISRIGDTNTEDAFLSPLMFVFMESDVPQILPYPGQDDSEFITYHWDQGPLVDWGQNVIDDTRTYNRAWFSTETNGRANQSINSSGEWYRYIAIGKRSNENEVWSFCSNMYEE